MDNSLHYNHVTLCGTVEDQPRFSHSNHNVRFFVFTLAVDRLSGQQDHLRVLAGAPLLSDRPLCPGDTVTVSGQLRSFNNKSGHGSRLVISVFAHQLTVGGSGHVNLIRLSGVVCKTPTFRRTPMGREICDVILAVNRRYGRADYLPCIAWGAVAQQVALMVPGDHLALEGRVQSRVYRKQIAGALQERTAYEVSVMRPADPAEFFPGRIDFAAEGDIMDPPFVKEGDFDDSVRKLRFLQL